MEKREYDSSPPILEKIQEAKKQMQVLADYKEEKKLLKTIKGFFNKYTTDK